MLETLKTIYNPKRNWKRYTAMVSKDGKEHIQYAYGENLSVIYAFIFTQTSDFILNKIIFYEILKGMGDQQVGMEASYRKQGNP